MSLSSIVRLEALVKHTRTAGLTATQVPAPSLWLGRGPADTTPTSLLFRDTHDAIYTHTAPEGDQIIIVVPEIS